jgi:ATP-dependent helicase HrpB
VRIRPLYGALPFRDQRAAIRPEAEGRKLVLATSIAETSLTIEDVRIVVDGGKARRARFDPARGMSRLVTEDVSRAEAEQRRGRAGRVAPGVCYRLWTRGQEGARPAFPPAEIEVTDLSSLALELAQWGGTEGLRFLTPPPEKALAEARTLLAALGALDDAGRITAHGRELVRLPLHPSASATSCAREDRVPRVLPRCCRTATRCAGRMSARPDPAPARARYPGRAPMPP